MIYDEQEAYTLPTYSENDTSKGTVELLEGPQVAPPPKPQPPRRRSNLLAIVLLAIVLSSVFAVGLFSGWEYVNSQNHTNSLTSTTATTKQSSSLTTGSETLREAAIAKVEPGVVELKVTTSSGEQIGSGVIIDTKGDIVTNNHVISSGQTVEVVLNTGKTEQAQIIATDEQEDLAIVRIQPFTNMTVVQLGNASTLQVGQEVMAIGNPLGITETVTDGIVSALQRSVIESSGATLTDTIQTSAAINQGNSGGALINLQGQLIGIPTVTAVNTETSTTANGISFAISSNVVAQAVQKMLNQ
jgi:S1-C subfamily serine protease